MKLLLQILIIISITSTIGFSQTVIERNVISRFIGKTTKSEIIINKSSLSMNKLDSTKFCNYVLKLYNSIDMDFYQSLQDGGLVISGSSQLDLKGYSSSTDFIFIAPILYISFTDSTPTNIKFTDSESKEVIQRQMRNTNRIIQDLQSL